MVSGVAASPGLPRRGVPHHAAARAPPCGTGRQRERWQGEPWEGVGRKTPRPGRGDPAGPSPSGSGERTPMTSKEIVETGGEVTGETRESILPETEGAKGQKVSTISGANGHPFRWFCRCGCGQGMFGGEVCKIGTKSCVVGIFSGRGKLPSPKRPLLSIFGRKKIQKRDPPK